MKHLSTQLHTKPHVLQREWSMDGIPVLTASVSLPEPVAAADNLSRRIDRYYRLQCRSYLRYCEQWLFPQAQAEYRIALETSTPLPSFQAELTYQVTYHDSGFWSLYTQSRERTLSGHTLFTRRGDTWNLKDGYPVSLPSFFPSRSPWKRRLLTLAAEEIQRQEAADTARYHDAWRRELRRRFNPHNFYLTPEGLVFFFPMYVIAPAIEGIPTFMIPYDEEGPFLPLKTPGCQ